MEAVNKIIDNINHVDPPAILNQVQVQVQSMKTSMAPTYLYTSASDALVQGHNPQLGVDPPLPEDVDVFAGTL